MGQREGRAEKSLRDCMEVGAQEGERGEIIGRQGSVPPGEEPVFYSARHGKAVRSFKQGVACSDLCISKSTLAWRVR